MKVLQQDKMSEISIILKDIRVMTLPEYRALDRYASVGRTWVIVKRETYVTVSQRSLEYMFEPENFLLFRLVSNNILTQWFTNNTRRLKVGEEYQIDTNMYIRLLSYGF